MKEVYVKKYWPEDDILFYLHFQDGSAARQIEITSLKKIYLSIENPVHEGHMLYDQKIEELDLNENDFISKQEFEKLWNKE